MFKKIGLFFRTKWNRFLFQKGRKVIWVKGLGAFNRNLSPGVILLTFIAGEKDFIGCYLPVRKRYPNSTYTEIAKNGVAYRSKTVSVAIGQEGGSAGRRIPTGQLSEERVKFLIEAAKCMGIVYGGELRVKKMLVNFLRRK